MSVKDKVFNLPHGLVKELRELAEIPDTQDAIKAAIAFYIKCLKFQSDGNLLLATPFKVTKDGKFIIDEAKVGQAIIISD